VQRENPLAGVAPLLTAHEVAIIISVNDQMLYRHIEEWKTRHPNALSFGGNQVFLRRGLALEREINTQQLYREWDFINSYSLAFSAPEKFAAVS
jgi:hypothetical protein